MPLVREMLEVRPAPNVTSATSDSRTESGLVCAHDQVPQIVHRFQGVGGLGDHRLCPIEKQACGEGHVVVAKGGGDLKEGDAVGRHLLKVRRDDEVAVNIPDQLDPRDPLKVLNLRDDQVLHQRLDLDEWPVRHYTELDHGKGVRVETAHGGVFHGGRKVHAIERILNKSFGCGHVSAVLECGKDRSVAFGGRGLNGLQPIGAGDSPLNRVRNITDHGLRVGGRIRCKYGDQGELDLWEQFHLHRTV